MDAFVFAQDAKVDKTVPPLTQDELTRGRYWWGDRRTKRGNTPDDWIYLHEGTRSAQWIASKQVR